MRSCSLRDNKAVLTTLQFATFSNTLNLHQIEFTTVFNSGEVLWYTERSPKYLLRINSTENRKGAPSGALRLTLIPTTVHYATGGIFLYCQLHKQS